MCSISKLQISIKLRFKVGTVAQLKKDDNESQRNRKLYVEDSEKIFKIANDKNNNDDDFPKFAYMMIIVIKLKRRCTFRA